MRGTYRATLHGPIAQWVEHLAHNRTEERFEAALDHQYKTSGKNHMFAFAYLLELRSDLSFHDKGLASYICRIGVTAARLLPKQKARDRPSYVVPVVRCSETKTPGG